MSDRFEYQRNVARKYTPKAILNIGCNEDPAGLGEIPGVINCDAYTNNNGRPYPVDLVFDCTVAPWPLEDDSAEIAIYGDIIEHMFPEELKVCLSETYRVCRRISGTVPYDTRILNDPDYFEKIKDVEKGVVHVHAYTEDELKSILEEAGFTIDHFEVVHYGFVPVGYFFEAHR